MNQKTIRTILVEYLRSNHNDNRVYHVTSDYYKQNIIDNGLRIEFEITQDQINSLETLLEHDDFIDLNINLNLPLFGNQRIMDRIKESFGNVCADDYTLSSSIDFMNIFDYLKEDTKGGQYLKEIKKLVREIEEKVKLDNNLAGHINANISSLINFINQIHRSGFLLCIIDKSDLENNGDEFRFQTTQNIEQERIIEIIELNKLI